MRSTRTAPERSAPTFMTMSISATPFCATHAASACFIGVGWAPLGKPTTLATNTPLSAKERFTALQSGEVDILSRNTTWTLVRDTALGLNFAGVNYYDGQGFMVRKDLGVKSALELSGGQGLCIGGVELPRPPGPLHGGP